MTLPCEQKFLSLSEKGIIVSQSTYFFAHKIIQRDFDF